MRRHRYVTRRHNRADRAARSSLLLQTQPHTCRHPRSLTTYCKVLSETPPCISCRVIESSISPHPLRPAYFQQPPKTQLRTPTIPPLTPPGMEYSANAHSISWPTVPNGTDRVYTCFCAGNTRTACSPCSRPLYVLPRAPQRLSSPATHSLCSDPLPAAPKVSTSDANYTSLDTECAHL